MSGINIVGPGGIIEGTTSDVDVNVNLDAALDFDGTNDLVDLNYGNGVNAQAGFSVAFWAKLDDNFTGSPNQMFIGSSTGTNQRFYIGTNSTRWSFGYASSGWSSSGTQTAFAGKWHHVCVTATSGAQKLYVNGVEITAQAKTDSSTFNLHSDLGAGAMFGGAYYSNGTMTDIKIFGDVLTAAEVQELASKPNYDITAGSIDNLTRWFKTNTGSGTTIADDSGNSGTAADITGATWVYDQFYLDLQNESTGGSGTFTVTRGKVQGLALTSYDFSASALNVAYDTHGFTSGTNFAAQAITMACWIRPEASNAMGIMGFAGLNGSGGKSIAFGIDVDRNDALSMAVTFMDNDSTYGNPQNVGINASSLLDQNKWYHLAVTYNGGGATTLSNFNFYINGQLVETGKATGTTTIYNHSPSFMGNSVVVGKCGGDPVNGKVRDVRTYDSVLSAKEIASICANTNVASPNELWYKFDATSGVTDESTADLGAANTSFLPDANYVNGTFDLDGTLTIAANGTLSAPRGSLSLANDFENAGTYTHNNGTFETAGNIDINVSSTVDPVFYNFTNNNTVNFGGNNTRTFTIENIHAGTGHNRPNGTITLNYGTSSSSGTINTTGYWLMTNNNGTCTIQATDTTGLNPVQTHVNNRFDESFGLVSGEHWKWANINITSPFRSTETSYTNAVTHTLLGDCSFAAATIDSGDTFDMNGQRAEFGNFEMVGGGTPGAVDWAGSMFVGTGTINLNGKFPTSDANTIIIHDPASASEKAVTSMYTNGTFFNQNNESEITGYGWTSGTPAYVLDKVIVGGTLDCQQHLQSEDIQVAVDGELRNVDRTITCEGDLTMSGGLIGKSALSFPDGGNSPTGAGNALDVPYDLVNLTGDATIEFWMKADANTNANSRGVINGYKAGVGNRWQLYHTTSNNLTFYSHDYNKSITVTCPTGKWSHVAIVCTGAGGDVKLYINGKLEGQTELGSGVSLATSGAFPDFGVNRQDGSTDIRTGQSIFEGELAMLRIWTDERTQSELRANMFATYANLASNTDCAIAYDFDEGTGTDVDDKVGSNNGTLINSVTWAGGGGYNKGTGTIDMTGNGTLCIATDVAMQFNNLKVAASGKTTTFQVLAGSSDIRYHGTLTHGGGTANSSGNPAWTMKGTATVSAGSDWTNWYLCYWESSTAVPTASWKYWLALTDSTLAGDMTCTGYFRPHQSVVTFAGNTVTTNDAIFHSTGGVNMGSGSLIFTQSNGLSSTQSDSVFTGGPGATVTGVAAKSTFMSQNNFVLVGKAENLNVTNEELSVTGQVINCTGEIHQQFPTIDHDQQLDFDTADDRDIILGRDLDKNTELINS